MSQRPVAVGLTICEQVIVEEKTKNTTLVNSFTGLKVDRFPSVPRPFTVYAVLTDGLGEVAVDLVVSRLMTLEDIYIQPRSVVFTDRLLEVRVPFRLNRCSFPLPGRYQFSLLADGELIAQRVLQVSALGS
jgi:hypothetical protein